MELQQLKYFKTVAQLQHMTRAAEELHITQPSLSITISRLEESLGVPLFDRYGRQIKLNEFGKAFLRRVERIFMELEEGQLEVLDLAGLNHGTVTVASTNLSFLPDLLNGFLSKYPQMKFRLLQESMSRTQKLLENGEVDFCISSPPIEGRGVSQAQLYKEEILLVVPSGHRLAGRSSIQLHELQAENFISLKAGYGIRDITDNMFKRAGFTPNIIFEIDSPSLVGDLVKAGLGIACIPAIAWKGEICTFTKGLHIEDSLKRIIGLSWLEERYLSAAARHFHDFVIVYFKGMELKKGNMS